MILIGFSKPGAKHPVAPTAIGAFRAPSFTALAVKDKPPAVRVIVDPFFGL
jgi:hypothetical protein